MSHINVETFEDPETFDLVWFDAVVVLIIIYSFLKTIGSLKRLCTD